MLKTYKGSCHCGAVRFEADVDISAGTGKCNCTYCAKVRLWSVNATLDTFRLVAGESDLIDYRGGKNEVAHHPFCRHCGIHAFDRVDTPNMTGQTYFNVSIACLDGVDVDELMAALVRYYNGLHDKWDQMPPEVRHL
jgi:hypothetical protein